jgi:aspartate-semialdehyde dehydrogenase
MTKNKLNITVVGATGLVGMELLDALERKNFPVGELKLYSTYNTAGEKVPFFDDEIMVKPIDTDFYKETDIVFFTAPEIVSRDLAEQAVEGGAIVIDSSSAFRLDSKVPLIVPEINGELLDKVIKGRKIVSIPSAVVTAMALVLHPLSRMGVIKRVVATTGHGSTALGQQGFSEHQNQTLDMFSGKDMVVEKMVRQASFNVFPRVGEFLTLDESRTEREIRMELPKVLDLNLPVAVTSLQVPVFCGVFASLNIEMDHETDDEQIRMILTKAKGLKVIDHPEEEKYPDTVTAMAYDDVTVGRIRKDPTSPNCVQIWISADNLRKGSSMNMAQIAQAIAEKIK